MQRCVRYAVAIVLAALAGLSVAVGPVAGAATAPHQVLATSKPWHYWISFVLVLSLVLMLVALAAGYVWRVILVKYGFRSEK